MASTNTAWDFEQKDFTEGTNAMVQNGFYALRSGDVYVELKPGWLDSTYRTGTSHGSPYSYDTHVPLIFYGWQIPHGRTDAENGHPANCAHSFSFVEYYVS